VTEAERAGWRRWEARLEGLGSWLEPALLVVTVAALIT
jgi:hypothetical protein